MIAEIGPLAEKIVGPGLSGAGVLALSDAATSTGAEAVGLLTGIGGLSALVLGLFAVYRAVRGDNSRAMRDLAEEFRARLDATEAKLAAAERKVDVLQEERFGLRLRVSQLEAEVRTLGGEVPAPLLDGEGLGR